MCPAFNARLELDDTTSHEAWHDRRCAVVFHRAGGSYNAHLTQQEVKEPDLTGECQLGVLSLDRRGMDVSKLSALAAFLLHFYCGLGMTCNRRRRTVASLLFFFRFCFCFHFYQSLPLSLFFFSDYSLWSDCPPLRGVVYPPVSSSLSGSEHFFSWITSVPRVLRKLAGWGSSV